MHGIECFTLRPNVWLLRWWSIELAISPSALILFSFLLLLKEVCLSESVLEIELYAPFFSCGLSTQHTLVTICWAITILQVYYCCSVAQSCLSLHDPMDLPSPRVCLSSCLFRIVMPSSHLTFWKSIRVFSSESTVCIRWPKYWSSVSASFLPVNIQWWFPLRLTGLISLQPKGHSRVFSNTTVRKHQFFGALLSLWYSSDNHTWPLERP